MRGRLEQYWADRRATQAQLSDPCYLTSVRNSAYGMVGGRVMRVPTELAAKCLVEATHRLSTQEEIEEYEADQQRRKEALFGEQARRSGAYVVQLPQRGAKR